MLLLRVDALGDGVWARLITTQSGDASYGTDPVAAVMTLADQVLERFPGSVFFAGTLVFREENWVSRLLHNYTALAIQRALHLRGVPLIIMPMKVDDRRPRPAPTAA